MFDMLDVSQATTVTCSVWEWGKALHELRIRDQEEEGLPNRASQVCTTLSGTSGGSQTTNWSSLPEGVAQVVLAKLSLIEFARITATCTSFREAYCRRLSREQEALRQLGIDTFGPERIRCLFDLTARLLKGEALPEGLMSCQYGYWICANGELQTPSVPPENGEKLHVSGSTVANTAVLTTFFGRGNRVMRVEFNKSCSLVEIEVELTNVEDLVPMALVQALVREGLIQIICDVDHHAKFGARVLRPSQWTCLPRGPRLTDAELRAHVASVLALVWHWFRSTPENTIVGKVISERMLSF